MRLTQGWEVRKCAYFLSLVDEMYGAHGAVYTLERMKEMSRDVLSRECA